MHFGFCTEKNFWSFIIWLQGLYPPLAMAITSTVVVVIGIGKLALIIVKKEPDKEILLS